MTSRRRLKPGVRRTEEASVNYIRKVTTLIVIVAALLSAAGGCAPVPKLRIGPSNASPAISESRNTYTYPGPVASIAEIRFSELTVYADTAYPLHSGKYHHDDAPEIGREDVELGDAALLRSSDGGPYAVISFVVVTCGGSCSPTGYVQVLAVREGHLVVRQQFRYIAEGKGTGGWFDSKSNTLRIVARTDDETPHCCPTHVDEAQYRWTGTEFQLSDSITRPIKK